MKVFALTLTALCLANVAQGLDYELQCTKDEMGIRWPSYHSSSEFYMCNRIGGKSLKMSCGHGELFTFVLQSCTSPGRYIPAPPMNILPTSSSMTPDFSLLPKPIYSNEDKPSIVLAPQHPPVISGEHPKPITHELPHESDVKESEGPIETKEELSEMPPSLPIKPIAPGVDVPLPPTPAPTPPVVKKPVKPQPQVPGKKQLAAPNKKQPAAPNKKQPAPTDNKKKPVQPSKKQQVPENHEPKAVKKPPTAKKAQKPAPVKE
ncbi:uncharacterized protein LOC105220685 [Zeugodacus cucurbitae]|uniref:uncharacterized protein LOC105220685 n=1 Tax=Zeugodacus cucurbitae TaxID=28588 RepID=UPI0005969146|nr:uncharacterized protein LOC105220685 [Zeugodacus cucurbitae]